MRLSSEPMRLSEAIRLGATISEKTTGTLYQNGRTCSMGSALLAIGAKLTNRSQQDEYYKLIDLFPESRLKVHPPCRCWDGLRSELHSVIIHLNDHIHNWTREQIADWVDTVIPPKRSEANDSKEQADQSGAGRTAGTDGPVVQQSQAVVA